VNAPRLTFDDGPSDSTEAMLDLLSRYGLRAHFFVVGRRVLERPKVVKRAAAEGHVVGNHTWDHAPLSQLSEDTDVIDQLSRASDAIAEVIGTPPDIFRAPYGLVDDRGRRLAATLGLNHMGWDVDTKDYMASEADSILAAIVNAGANDVVLLHDGDGDIVEGPNEHPLTVTAVAAALRCLAGS